MSSLVYRFLVVTVTIVAASVHAATSLIVPVSLAKKAGPDGAAGQAVHFQADAAHRMTPGDVALLQLGEERHAVTFERSEVNAPGTRTWIGYLANHGTDYRVIATTGKGGTFADIHTPDGRWSLVPDAQGERLTDPITAQLNAPIVRMSNDGIAPPLERLKGRASGAQAKADAADPDCPQVSARPTPQTTIDWMLVYTDDYVAHFGAANVQTRIAQLTASVNNLFAQSNIAITLRVVHSVQVSYPAPSAVDDSTALDDITNGTGVFANVAALRNQYGADIVSLLRGPMPDRSIGGIAWIGGSSRTPIADSVDFMYSVIGDAQNFSGGLAAHEIGHNLGNAHDRANSRNSTGGLQFGVTSYSFGYVRCSDGSNGTNGAMPTCASSAGFNNPGATGFGTLMSYTTQGVLKFESPNLTCTINGVSAPCGIDAGPDGTPTPAGAADTVRSMNCVRQAVANMKSAGLDPAGDEDGDGIPNGIEQTQGTNPLAKDNDVFAATPLGNRLFVMQQHRDIYGREATSTEITTWTNAMAGGATRASVIDQLLTAPEHEDLVGPQVRLYFAYFLRLPDYGGLSFWVTQYKNRATTGWEFQGISEFFSISPEFQQRYGALNTNQFVTLIYNNVLNRAPEPSGFAYWTDELNSGRRIRGNVMAAFSESPENKALKAPEVRVVAANFAMLRAIPDQASFESWTGQIKGGTSSQSLINNILSNSAYRARFLP